MSKPLTWDQLHMLLEQERESVKFLLEERSRFKADAEMWEQSAKEHMGLCVKLEQRLAELSRIGAGKEGE